MIIRLLFILCLFGLTESVAETKFQANNALQQLRFDRVLMEKYSKFGTRHIAKADRKDNAIAFAAAERVFDLVLLGKHSKTTNLPKGTKIYTGAKNWHIRKMAREEIDNNVAEFMAVTLGIAADILKFRQDTLHVNTLSDKLKTLTKRVLGVKLKSMYKKHLNISASVINQRVSGKTKLKALFRQIFKHVGPEDKKTATALLNGDEGFNAEFAAKEFGAIQQYNFARVVEFDIPNKATKYNLGLYSKLHNQIALYRLKHLRKQSEIKAKGVIKYIKDLYTQKDADNAAKEIRTTNSVIKKFRKENAALEAKLARNNKRTGMSKAKKKILEGQIESNDAKIWAYNKHIKEQKKLLGRIKEYLKNSNKQDKQQQRIALERIKKKFTGKKAEERAVRTLATYMVAKPESDIKGMARLLSADVLGKYDALKTGVNQMLGYAPSGIIPAYIRENYVDKKKSRSIMWVQFDDKGKVGYSYYQSPRDSGNNINAKVHYNEVKMAGEEASKRRDIRVTGAVNTSLTVYADTLATSFDLSNTKYTWVNFVANQVDPAKANIQLPFEYLNKCYIVADKVLNSGHVEGFVGQVMSSGSTYKKPSEVHFEAEDIVKQIPDDTWKSWKAANSDKGFPHQLQEQIADRAGYYREDKLVFVYQ